MSSDCLHNFVAAQAIQLTWRTVKQLLAEDDLSVVTRALDLVPRHSLILAIITACLQLPVCSFATPKTWSGMCVHSATCHGILWMTAVHLLHAATYHVRVRFGVMNHLCHAAPVHLQAGKKTCCSCAASGSWQTCI